ncbi:sal-like protein 2 isoform X1 [Pleurodeles waltl]|uniref:sal-like protein 2 isoform X1 n=2 Tax=Pleurodeles waltl TaxID=8319 RepID=UPI003709C17A
MSRRKQRKPQQVISDCETSTGSENGDTADEELQVCTKCCAQFEDQEDLVQHRDRCPVNDPVVVIVANQEDGTPATLQRVKPPEAGAAFKAADTQCPGLIVGTPEMQVPRVGATPTNGECKSSGVTGFPRMGCSRSYWSDPRSKDSGSSQPFLSPSSGLNQERATSPRIGQAPHDTTPGGAPPSTPLNIPMILEELRVLQQRQIHQMQMTEQICRQVLMLGSLAQPAVPLAAGGGPSPTPPGAGSKSTPAFSAIKLTPVPEVAKTVPAPEVPKQAFFQLYNPLGNPFNDRSLPAIPNMKPKTLPHFEEKSLHSPASLPTSPQSQLLSTHAAFPTGILGPQVSMFLGARAVEPIPSLLKQKNGEAAYAESLQEKSSGRHKCRFCAKVFGSDSALQIHLRSHTGERPYKCNICGNRFTTRGNLKVHFQRHKDKYPHIQMNPHPVPEHLDYMLNGNGLPYGMSVPPEKSEEEPAEKKPLISALSATESLTLLSAGQTLPPFNKFMLMKPGETSTVQKSVSSGAKSKADENTPPTGQEVLADNSSSRMQLGKLATSLPNWAMLANHFKASSFPFPYVVDPLGSSETFKLQQLVEKIDKQASNPNQCIICLRVLSCPRALRLHYSQHGGERPFKCKICGRAFSTRGNLKAHFVGHKSSPAEKAQNSCPICQKKFTNAVTLQQHIRMHLGGQIPNGVMPDGTGAKAPSLDESFPEQDFSDEGATDEDSLEASGSESEKLQGSAESDILNLGEEATISISNEDQVAMSSSRKLPPVLPVCGSPPSYTASTDTIPAESCSNLQQSFKPNELTAIEALTNLSQSDGSQEAEEPMEQTPEHECTPLSLESRSVDHEDQVTLGEKMQEVANFTCYICSASFPTMESLGQHIKGHSNDGLFQCPVCKQRFLERNSLLSHMLRNHPGVGRSPPSATQKSLALGTQPAALASSLLWPKPQATITPLPSQVPLDLWPKSQTVITSPPVQTLSLLWPRPQVAILPPPSQPSSELQPTPQAVVTPPPTQVLSELWQKPQAAITPLPAQTPSDLWLKPQETKTPPCAQVAPELLTKSQPPRTPPPNQGTSEHWPKHHPAITSPSAQVAPELIPQHQAAVASSLSQVPLELWTKPQPVITPPPTQAASDLWSKHQSAITPLQAKVAPELWSKYQPAPTPPPDHTPAELQQKAQTVMTPPPASSPLELQLKTQAAITLPPAEAVSELQLDMQEVGTPRPVQVSSEQWSKTQTESSSPAHASSVQLSMPRSEGTSPAAHVLSEVPPKTEASGLPHMSTFLRSFPPSSVMPFPAESNSRPHLCPVCQKTFSSVNALQIHERIHTEEKPFSCTMCERVFTTQGNLKVHMSTHVWDSSHPRVTRPMPPEPVAPPLLPGPPNQTPPNIPAGEDPVQLAKSGPLSFWNQYTAFLARSSENPTMDPASPAPQSPRPPSRASDVPEITKPTAEDACPDAVEV